MCHASAIRAFISRSSVSPVLNNNLSSLNNGVRERNPISHITLSTSVVVSLTNLSHSFSFEAVGDIFVALEYDNSKNDMSNPVLRSVSFRVSRMAAENSLRCASEVVCNRVIIRFQSPCLAEASLIITSSILR